MCVWNNDNRRIYRILSTCFHLSWDFGLFVYLENCRATFLLFLFIDNLKPNWCNIFMDVCLDWNVSIVRRLFVITWNLLCHFMYLYQYALSLCLFLLERSSSHRILFFIFYLKDLFVWSSKFFYVFDIILKRQRISNDIRQLNVFYNFICKLFRWYIFNVFLLSRFR